jgi:hypothetical protein
LTKRTLAAAFCFCFTGRTTSLGQETSWHNHLGDGQEIREQARYTEGTKLELQSDSSSGLVNYLKQAAALNPSPSSLEKRIAEIEARPPAPVPKRTGNCC